MEFCELNSYILEDILKYVPLLERFILSRVSSHWNQALNSLWNGQTGLEFSRLKFDHHDSHSIRCDLHHHRIHESDHVQLIGLQAEEFECILSHFLTKCPKLLVLNILNMRFPLKRTTEELIDKNCPKLEHIELCGERFDGLGQWVLKPDKLTCLKISLRYNQSYPSIFISNEVDSLSAFVRQCTNLVFYYGICRATDINEAFTDNRNIRKVILRGDTYGSVRLPEYVVKQLPNLTYIGIGKPYDDVHHLYRPSCYQMAMNLEHLTEIDFNHDVNFYRDQFVLLMQKLGNQLVAINFNGNYGSADNILPVLVKCAINLKSLALRSDNIKKSVDLISKFKKLTKLELFTRSCEVRTKQVDQLLQSCSKLRYIRIEQMNSSSVNMRMRMEVIRILSQYAMLHPLRVIKVDLSPMPSLTAKVPANLMVKQVTW
ncbi:hypothetical protein HDE_09468 [Halotydeus destructor]|nr:hypothetical protein HDE_09468 [Halotydeus destructor]